MSYLKKNDIIDEIIDVLEEERAESPFAYVSKETLGKFLAFERVVKERHPVKNVESVVFSDRGSASKKIEQLGTEKSFKKLENSEIKSTTIEQLHDTVCKCRNCALCSGRLNTVFGEGSITAELMLIGEGPGRDEDEQGRPFVGKSGQLLGKMLKAMGYAREDVYIANIVKCRPPDNRNPSPEEAAACLPYLLRQIELVHPKCILLLGAVPLKFILNKTGITKIRGQWFEFNGIKTIASFHPSYLLRDESQKKFAWADLQKIMEFLGVRKKQSQARFAE